MKFKLKIIYDSDDMKTTISKEISRVNMFLFPLIDTLNKIKKDKNSVLFKDYKYASLLKNNKITEEEYNLLSLLTQDCQGDIKEIANSNDPLINFEKLWHLDELKYLLKSQHNGNVIFFEGFKLTIKND